MLVDRMTGDAQKAQAENPNAEVPMDLITTSGSGLDPQFRPKPRISGSQSRSRTQHQRVRPPHCNRQPHGRPPARIPGRTARKCIGIEPGSRRNASDAQVGQASACLVLTLPSLQCKGQAKANPTNSSSVCWPREPRAQSGTPPTDRCECTWDAQDPAQSSSSAD